MIEADLRDLVARLDPFMPVYVATHSGRTQLRGRAKPFHCERACRGTNGRGANLRQGRLNAQIIAGRRPCSWCWPVKFAIHASVPMTAVPA